MRCTCVVCRVSVCGLWSDTNRRDATAAVIRAATQHKLASGFFFIIIFFLFRLDALRFSVYTKILFAFFSFSVAPVGVLGQYFKMHGL